jgi:hypothetical protein
MKSGIKDIILSTSIITLSLAIFVESYSIRKLVGDVSMGTAMFPRAVTIMLTLLSLRLLIKGIRNLLVNRNRAGLRQPSPENKTSSKEQSAIMLNLIGLLVLTVLYVSSLYLRIHFAITTTLFIFSTVILLGGFLRKSVVYGLILGLILGFGIRYIFTRFFFIDLP